MIYVGVDFGGTKIEAAALNKEGKFLSRIRVNNPGNYNDAISELVNLVNNCVKDAKLKNPEYKTCDFTIGIGVPGSVSPIDGLMHNANTVWLNGKDFQADLNAAFKREVKIANDANCLALSEAFDGAGKNSASVFAVILGTGCGGGLVNNKNLIEGANGIAGEWGHLPLPWPNETEFPAPLCWCKKQGCIELWISGSGVARDHKISFGEDIKTETIIENFRKNEPKSTETFNKFIDRLARSIMMVINIYDPEMFVFGGGLSNVNEIYDLLPSKINALAFGNSWQGKLKPAIYGDSSGVRGAAYLWRQEKYATNIKEHEFSKLI